MHSVSLGCAGERRLVRCLLLLVVGLAFGCSGEDSTGSEELIAAKKEIEGLRSQLKERDFDSGAMTSAGGSAGLELERVREALAMSGTRFLQLEDIEPLETTGRVLYFGSGETGRYDLSPLYTSDGVREISADADRIKVVLKPGTSEFEAWVAVCPRIARGVPGDDWRRILELRPLFLEVIDGMTVGSHSGLTLSEWEHGYVFADVQDSAAVELLVSKQGVEHRIRIKLKPTSERLVSVDWNAYERGASGEPHQHVVDVDVKLSHVASSKSYSKAARVRLHGKRLYEIRVASKHPKAKGVQLIFPRFGGHPDRSYNCS